MSTTIRQAAWSRSVLALGLFLAAAQSAEALPIIAGTTTATATGNQTSQNEINQVIDNYIGTPLSDYFLYKQDVGGGESGALAGSYDTSFNNIPGGPSEALIDYVGGGADMVDDVAWLLVKDGNHSPAWYLFNLTALGWDGFDNLELSNFWPEGGAISHVSLYGTRTTPVPEPTTLSLLGAGLIGLVLSRRRRQIPSA